jgi:hypothetical protein
LSNILSTKRVLSNESIHSQASDHSTTRDIKSAVFPVTIDKSGHNSLGFLVVVWQLNFFIYLKSCFSNFKGGLDSEIEDHGIYVKSITPDGAASKSKLLIEGNTL